MGFALHGGHGPPFDRQRGKCSPAGVAYLAAGLLCVAGAVCAEHRLERLVLEDPRRVIDEGAAALGLSSRLEERIELLGLMGRAAVHLADEAALTEILLRLETESDPRANGIAHVLRADRLRDRDRREEALAQALSGAELLTEAPAALRLEAELMLCLAYIANRRWAESELRCAQAAHIARDGNDDYLLARVENVQSFIPYYQGRLAEAIAVSERALHRARRIGARGMTAVIESNLSQAYLDAGRNEEALALAQSSFQGELGSGRAGAVADDRVNLARALHAMGRTDEALAQLATGIEEASRSEDARVLIELYEAQSGIAEASGKLEIALQAAHRLGALRERPDDRPSPGVLAELEARYQAREQTLRIRALEQERRADQLRLAEVALESERQRGWLVALMIAALAGVVVLAALAWALRMQRRLSTQLQELSERDPLTGVENRRAFMQHLDHLFDSPAPPDVGALMILDLDHFKSINDNYGHPFGDTVLLATVAAIKGALGDGCRLARLGGEEFAVLCGRQDASTAAALAERLREAVAGMRVAGPRGEVQLSVSIGVAARRADLAQPGAWLRAADAALYRAKHEGRNRVVLA